MAGTASEGRPIVYIFHGDDPHAIRQGVDEVLKKVLDPAMADINVTRLDGKQADEDALVSAANSMPFLAERRVVILSNPFSRLITDATRKRFTAILDGLPDSTALVLVVEDTLERRGSERDWKSLPMKNTFWMRKWLEKTGGKALYRLCQLPPIRQMPEWVRAEARRQGGQIQADAASALVEHVGNNTQMAELEIDKLLTYVDRKRPVEIEDVRELTTQSGEVDVFEMVDALAVGNSRQASMQLHRLLETQEPLSLFGMIVRQFRLLIQARELIDEGGGAQIQSTLRVHPYVAEKLSGQARRFQMHDLEHIYHRLLDLDEAMKSSQIPHDLALDTFVAELAR